MAREKIKIWAKSYREHAGFGRKVTRIYFYYDPGGEESVETESPIPIGDQEDVRQCAEAHCLKKNWDFQGLVS